MVIGTSVNDMDEIKKLILDGRCIAFIGATISTPPGPDWEYLVKEIAGKCNIPYDYKTSKPKIIDKCIEKNKEACIDILKEKLPKHIATTRTSIGYVLRLPFKAILTTNFDPWLRQQSIMEKYDKCYVYPDLPIRNGIQKSIYYIHGYLDSSEKDANIDSFVFGEKSFEEAYDDSLLPGFLLNILVYENILFICFNPLEAHFSIILEKSIKIRRMIKENKERPINLPKRFILWPNPETKNKNELAEQSNIINKMLTLDIKPVFYDRKNPDYRGLEEILFNWIEESDIKYRPAPFENGF